MDSTLYMYMQLPETTNYSMQSQTQLYCCSITGNVDVEDEDLMHGLWHEVSTDNTKGILHFLQDMEYKGVLKKHPLTLK